MARKPTATLPDTIALVLQGGGALGAYQAGVYQGLHESGVVPHWLGGISIGAFNTALIAGNPPERRVQALQEFWNVISQSNGPWPTTHGQDAPLVDWNGPGRAWLDSWEAWRALSAGQRGFFQPRDWATLLAAQGPFGGPGPEAASWYDTGPMLETLDRLVGNLLVHQRGAHEARADHIGADAKRAAFFGHRARQAQ